MKRWVIANRLVVYSSKLSRVYEVAKQYGYSSADVVRDGTWRPKRGVVTGSKVVDPVLVDNQYEPRKKAV